MPRLEQALFPNGLNREPICIDRIEISIIPGGQFRWALWSGAREIYAEFADRFDVATLMHATKTVVNAELGVPPDIGGADPGRT